MDRDEELDVWSYNLDVKPAKAEAVREFIGAFQQGQADEFLDALREVPAADELDGVPKLFTSRGLRLTWFRGQQGSETFELERGRMEAGDVSGPSESLDPSDESFPAQLHALVRHDDPGSS